jgi:hypothetical protein
LTRITLPATTKPFGLNDEEMSYNLFKRCFLMPKEWRHPYENNEELGSKAKRDAAHF